jgi:hypothetical protein
MNEKLIESKLRQAVEAVGGICLKLPAIYFTGIPDRLCLLPGGRAYFVETKTTGRKLRPRQQFVKRKLEVLGFRVYVTDSLERLTEFEKLCRPPVLSESERWELRDLERARRAIIAIDPSDDLSDEDLARLRDLWGREVGC